MDGRDGQREGEQGNEMKGKRTQGESRSNKNKEKWTGQRENAIKWRKEGED